MKKMKRTKIIKKMNAIEVNLKGESNDSLAKLKIYHDTEADSLKQPFVVVAILAFLAVVIKSTLDSITLNHPVLYLVSALVLLVAFIIIGLFYAHLLTQHILRSKVIDILIEKKKKLEETT